MMEHYKMKENISTSNLEIKSLKIRYFRAVVQTLYIFLMKKTSKFKLNISNIKLQTSFSNIHES